MFDGYKMHLRDVKMLQLVVVLLNHGAICFSADIIIYIYVILIIGLNSKFSRWRYSFALVSFDYF